MPKCEFVQDKDLIDFWYGWIYTNLIITFAAPVSKVQKTHRTLEMYYKAHRSKENQSRFKYWCKKEQTPY